MLKTILTLVLLLALILGLDVTRQAPWNAQAQPDLAALLAKAPPLAVEDVAQPVKSALIGNPQEYGLVLNPDRKSYDIIWKYAGYGTPNTLVVLDLGSGDVKILTPPADIRFGIGMNLEGVIAPDGRLFTTALGRGLHQELCIYDPGKNEMLFKAVKTPDYLIGETHPSRVGSDGKIYLGGAHHPTGAAAAAMVDPATLEIKSWGPLGPAHKGGCWVTSIGGDETHVYVASGKVPYYLLAVEKSSGEVKVLAETGTVDASITVGQGSDGCTANISNAGKRTSYWLYQGQAIPQNEPCPYKKGSGKGQLQGPMPPKPELYTENLQPGSDGKAETWIKGRVPNAATDPAFPGWSILRYQVPVEPIEINRVMELPDGTIFGTCGYIGHFIYDPAAGHSKYLGRTGLSHYATTVAGNHLYMSGYPSSPLIDYDLSKPWTAVVGGKGPGDQGPSLQDPASNPRRWCLLREKSGAHKMYSAAVGASGRIYFGGRWYRDGNAGGLAWWDPTQKAQGGFWDVFSNYQIDHLAAVADGKYIAISTHRVEDIQLGKPKPKQGKIFILDDATGKIVREIEPVTDAKGAGFIASAGGPRLIGWNEDPKNKNASILFGIDCDKGEVVWQHALPFPLPESPGSNQMGPFDFRLGPDGHIWTFMGSDGRTLVRIDPKTTAIQPVGHLPTRAGRMAFGKTDLYLAGTSSLRRIRGIIAGTQ